MLNAKWYKICEVCHKVWCASSGCESEKCNCKVELTAEMFYKGEIIITICGLCKREETDWLNRNDFERRLLPAHIRLVKGNRNG